MSRATASPVSDRKRAARNAEETSASFLVRCVVSSLASDLSTTSRQQQRRNRHSHTHKRSSDGSQSRRRWRRQNYLQDRHLISAPDAGGAHLLRQALAASRRRLRVQTVRQLRAAQVAACYLKHTHTLAGSPVRDCIIMRSHFRSCYLSAASCSKSSKPAHSKAAGGSLSVSLKQKSLSV